ncbi:MAG: hypothetical protein HW407_460 [Bacteroidetes bacterium]|nr:hypothetical protein [Bacteroidota bacterium]
MDFLLWSVRGVHIFSVVVWLGGLMYQGVVMVPVAKAEQKEMGAQTLHSLRRFVPFVWMCVWTVLVTGIGLMLFSPRYIIGEFDDPWSVLLGLKQLTFVLMVFFSFGYARMLSRCTEIVTAAKPGTSPDNPAPYYQRMLQFGRINVALGIGALLLASGLH